MGRLGSMGMWTIGMTRIMGIMGRSRSVERSRSTTSKRMRRGMGEGILWLRRDMMADRSMRCRGSTVVGGRVAGIRGNAVVGG